MAPELLEYKDDYTGKVDIWALGWTYFEMLFKSDPFPLEQVKGYVSKIYNSGRSVKRNHQQ